MPLSCRFMLAVRQLACRQREVIGSALHEAVQGGSADVNFSSLNSNSPLHSSVLKNQHLFLNYLCALDQSQTHTIIPRLLYFVAFGN